MTAVLRVTTQMDHTHVSAIVATQETGGLVEVLSGLLTNLDVFYWISLFLTKHAKKLTECARTSDVF